LALLEQGRCVLDREAAPQPVIEFLNFATRQMTPFARLEKTKTRQGNPAVSADGRGVLYWQVDQIDNDIMLVENFP